MSMSNSPEQKHGKWSEEEDECLKQAVSTYGEKQWRYIAEKVPGRSPIQCLHRWSKILKPGLIKGSWSAHEDFLLRQWVENQGCQKWSMCSKNIPGRSGKQCRERWFNILNPNVKKGDWKPEEDALIFQMFQTCGPKWTMIAGCLEGRTENSIKNRFYSTIRKMKAQGQEIITGVKLEEREEKIPETEEKMTTLISQIHHFQVLLDSTRNQILQLENSLDTNLGDSFGDLKIFQNGLPPIIERNFKKFE
jgi:Myb-like DNA-binding domain